MDNVGVTHISRSWIHAKHASAGKAKTETKAVKRMVANFSKEKSQDEWDLMQVGPLVKEIGYGGQDFANALIAEDQNRLCFQGALLLIMRNSWSRDWCLLWWRCLLQRWVLSTASQQVVIQVLLCAGLTGASMRISEASRQI